jgi:hypothetical protein
MVYIRLGVLGTYIYSGTEVYTPQSGSYHCI